MYRMKKGGGAAKGSSFERKMCRTLSLWVSGGASADLFWRTAGSGARATSRFKRGDVLAHQAGDMSAALPEGQPFLDRFFVEMKHLKDWEWPRLVYGEGRLLAIWKEARQKAADFHKVPLLIGKANHRPEFIGTTAPSSVYLFPDIPRLHLPRFDLILFPLSDFLATVDPNEFLDHNRSSSNRPAAGRVPVEPVRPNRRARVRS